MCETIEGMYHYTMCMLLFSHWIELEQVEHLLCFIVLIMFACLKESSYWILLYEFNY